MNTKRRNCSAPLVAAMAALCGAFSASVSLSEDDPPEEQLFAATPDGCKFINPYPNRRRLENLTWGGECVDGFVHGSGEITATIGDKPISYLGDFERGYIVKGVVTHGPWVYEGSFKDNKPSGEGEFRSLMFSVKGVFENGKPGSGVFEATYPNGHYVGQISPNTFMADGQGTFYYPSGSSYEGTLKGNIPDGEGVVRHPNGVVIRGVFVDGEVSEGSIEWPDGGHYEGEIRFDSPHGRGKRTYPDGTTYEGEYEHGYARGKGKIVWVNGNWYEGDFLHGNPHGHGSYFYADSKGLYVGELVAGQPEGEGRVDFDDGSFKEGQWHKGELNGECRTSLPDQAYVGTCVDGMSDGSGRLEVFATNQVYEGEFKAGLFHGEGVLRTGDSIYEGTFSEGRIHGKGKLTIGPITLEGEFRNAEFVKGTVHENGRTFQIDLEQGEILEVLPDGSKKPIDEMPDLEV